MPTANLRIYANSSLGTGPARPPRSRDGFRPYVVPRPKPALSIQAQIELEMSRILEAAPRSGESVQVAFDIKEKELRQLFETMTVEECAALHATLTNSHEAVAGFRRLAVERRARVLGALAAASHRRKSA